MAEWWGRGGTAFTEDAWKVGKLKDCLVIPTGPGGQAGSCEAWVLFLSLPQMDMRFTFLQASLFISSQSSHFSISEQMFVEQSLVVSHSSDARAARVDSKTTLPCWS